MLEESNVEKRQHAIIAGCRVRRVNQNKKKKTVKLGKVKGIAANEWKKVERNTREESELPTTNKQPPNEWA